MRLAAGVEYLGTRYMGWQRQRHGPSVQAELERSLGLVADGDIEVTCAGRTDAGVHATGQVVHFDTGVEREPRNWLLGGNTHLPDDVSIGWVSPVDADFHARYTATERCYRYLVLNRTAPSALAAGRAYLTHPPLDAAAMHEAGQLLLGEHDFSAFRAAGCQASTPNRCVLSLDVTRRGDWLTIEVRANAFLQHMVRNITGMLVTVGRGDLPVAAAGELLAARDRTKAPFAAPAHGLYLTRVSYPERFALTASADAWPSPGAPPEIPGTEFRA